VTANARRLIDAAELLDVRNPPPKAVLLSVS
jgi:hypothetical protein